MLEGFDKIEQVKPVGRASLLIGSGVSVSAAAAIGGIKEGAGPYGSCFDYIDKDDRFGQDSFEGAESAMQGLALQTVLEKRGVSGKDISVLFGGDLLNQCAGSAYALRGLSPAYLGLYGACSTMAESLLLASLLIDGGCAKKVAALTSSHFCSAERQFRFPLEYGSVRPPTSQWTVTGAGALILGDTGPGPYVTFVTPGRIVDAGITDANNMGAAMAPAACDTLTAHFRDTGRTPSYYDAVITGDLGLIGRDIVRELMGMRGIDLGPAYTDCGVLIYDSAAQDTHAGGSGCGCSASVLAGHILRCLREGVWKRVLFAATGALMSPTTTLQGESIPGICHAVALENVRC